MATLDPLGAFTKIIRTRLVSDPAFTALVPPDRVKNDFADPGSNVIVVIGNGEVTYPQIHERYFYTGFLDVEIFVRDPNHAKTRQIIAAAHKALGNPPWHGDGFVIHGCSITSQIDRDLDEPELSRGLLTLDLVAMEA